MTAKRFKFNGMTNCIEYDGKSILLDSYGEDIEELLNELHNENEQLKYNLSAHMVDLNNYKGKCSALEIENEQLKQFKDTTFVLINEMIETANLYRTPIKSLHYGDDLGYWNGVYQKLKELKEILFEKGDVE